MTEQQATITEQQVEEPKAVKGPRLLAKWDYIGSAIFFLSALIKMVFLWIREEFFRKSG